MPQARLYSALEILSIEDVESEREGILRRCFSPEERAEVGDRRVQTTAGFFAAKRALVRLFERLGRAGAVRESDFVLTHRDNGAPGIVAAPGDPRPELDLRVSISHTKRFAYGLAVAAEVVRG